MNNIPEGENERWIKDTLIWGLVCVALGSLLNTGRMLQNKKAS